GRLSVGRDPSVLRLAAASGCPTIGLFGPTDPRLWGPVPAAGLDPIWEAAGTIQRRKNVWLVQHPLPCLPCHNEGCERHIGSFSRCLDELQPAQVLRAVDAALSSTSAPAAGGGTRGGGGACKAPLCIFRGNGDKPRGSLVARIERSVTGGGPPGIPLRPTGATV